MKVLIDMNLSPEWVDVLRRHGFAAEHWSVLGDPRAQDDQIMKWASSHEYVVFTHDLDFGTILATTQATGPSVLQVRTQDVMPAALENLVVGILKTYEAQLAAGAIVVVDELRQRVRLLPIRR